MPPASTSLGDHHGTASWHRRHRQRLTDIAAIAGLANDAYVAVGSVARWKLLSRNWLSCEPAGRYLRHPRWWNELGRTESGQAVSMLTRRHAALCGECGHPHGRTPREPGEDGREGSDL